MDEERQDAHTSYQDTHAVSWSFHRLAALRLPRLRRGQRQAGLGGFGMRHHDGPRRLRAQNRVARNTAPGCAAEIRTASCPQLAAHPIANRPSRLRGYFPMPSAADWDNPRSDRAGPAWVTHSCHPRLGAGCQTGSTLAARPGVGFVVNNERADGHDVTSLSGLFQVVEGFAFIVTAI